MEKISLTFWQKAACGVALTTVLIVLSMLFGNFGSKSDDAKVEALKLVLQFALVTSGGGLLLAYLNKRRDDEARIADTRSADQERAAVRRSALQELIIELGDAHRRLKIVNRQMRAQILRQNADGDAELVPPFSVRIDAFERAMEALLNAQIAAEEVRDRIGIRSDIMDVDQIGRVRKALKYGARYFHDVYQDYERCLVIRKDEYFVIGSSCTNLVNFLTAKNPPSHLDESHQRDLMDQFGMMKDDDRSLVQRHAALDRIEELRESDPLRRRYRVVATECFALAADEMRDAARREIRIE